MKTKARRVRIRKPRSAKEKHIMDEVKDQTKASSEPLVIESMQVESRPQMRGLSALQANDWKDTREAAAYLGMAHDTLMIWRSTKKTNVPYYKIGGSVRYKQADLDEFLASRKVTA